MNSVSRINDDGHESSRRESVATAVQVAAMRVAGLFIATLREIFDEAAYARFLGRDGQVTRESYAAFVKQREAKVVRRPRCC